MVNPVRLIEGVTLASSNGTLFTVQANAQVIIKKITITNSDTVAHTATLYLVPNGGTAGVQYLVLDARPIAGLSTYDVTEVQNHVLMAGDTIQGFADDGTHSQLQASGVLIV